VSKYGAAPSHCGDAAGHQFTEAQEPVINSIIFPPQDTRTTGTDPLMTIRISANDAPPDPTVTFIWSIPAKKADNGRSSFSPQPGSSQQRAVAKLWIR
jgi:hypothetical protein